MAKKTLHPRETESPICHKNIISYLERVVQNNSIPHAFLFTGTKGVGKATTAFHFAKILLSKGKNETKQEIEFDLFGGPISKPIENNLIKKEVSEKIKNNICLDLIYIQKEEDKKNIAIENIREINKFLSLSTADSLYRVLIIDSVDDLNLSSSNALLKILEEPSKNTVIILINHDENTALETIKSRCIELKFHALNKEDFKSILEKQGYKENLDYIYKITDGSIGLAIEIIEKNILDLTDKYQKIISNKIVNITEISALTKKIKDEDCWNIFKNIFLKEYYLTIKNKSNPLILNKFSIISKLLHLSSVRNMDVQDTLKILSYQINN